MIAHAGTEALLCTIRALEAWTPSPYLRGRRFAENAEDGAVGASQHGMDS